MNRTEANEILSGLVEAIRSERLLPWAVQHLQDEDVLKKAWAAASDDVLMAKVIEMIAGDADQASVVVWCGDASGYSVPCAARARGEVDVTGCADCCDVTRQSFGELTVQRLVEMWRSTVSNAG